MAWEVFGILNQPHRTSAFVQNLPQLCCPHHLVQCAADTNQGPIPLALSVVFPSLPATLYVLLRWYLISALHQQSGFGFPPSPFGWGTFCFSVCCSAGAHAGLCLCILLLSCTAMCSYVDRWEGHCRRGPDCMKSQTVWDIFKQPCPGHESKHKSDLVSFKLLYYLQHKNESRSVENLFWKH